MLNKNFNFSALFEPKSIAVVGASHTPGKVGNDIVKNLVQEKFLGKVFPVNPKKGQMYDLPVYESLHTLPIVPDLVIIVLPSTLITEVLEAAGQLHVPAAIVISSGFKEVGNHKLEQEVVAVCQKHNITLLGPNSLGVLNPRLNMNASFAPLMSKPGNVAFLSQSGALCSSVLDYATTLGMGFSKFASIGNKAMIGELELLQYLYQDTQTKVIMMYVEDLSKAAELVKLAKTITSGRKSKPIIMLKSGKTKQGASASASHTGALAGNDVAYTALSVQSGILRVETIEEMFLAADVFSDNRYKLQGSKIAVVTNAGGPGVLTTDELIKHGLQLATLKPKTTNHLKKHLPAAANIKNPIDVLGDADSIRYRTAIEAVLSDSGVDGVLVILTPQSMTEVESTARAIAHLKQHSRKPIVASFMGHSLTQPGRDLLTKADVTTTTFPESAAKAFRALYSFKTWQEQPVPEPFSFQESNAREVSNLIEKAAKGTLSVEDSFQVLKPAGFPIHPSYTVTSQTQAQDLVKQKKLPDKLVVKILSPNISHKSDVGGVMLNVPRQDLPVAYRKMVRTVRRRAPKAIITGVQVTKMVEESGLELILGATTDPHLGPLLMVGWGGVYTELLKDVAWGLAPLTKQDAARMVQSLKAHHLIKGYRHQPKLDEKAVIQLLGRLSELMVFQPRIKEIDLNPVLVKESGISILDARIVIE